MHMFLGLKCNLSVSEIHNLGLTRKTQSKLSNLVRSHEHLNRCNL